MTTLDELITRQTDAQAFERIMKRLVDANFPITDWQPGGVARTLVEMGARESSFFSTAQVMTARSGFLSTAAGGWLTLFAREMYGLERYEARFTEGEVTLHDAKSEGPFGIEPGQLWFSDGMLRYTNTTGGLLEQGGELVVSVRAENAGAAYNVANNTIHTMLTPLVGVTAINTVTTGTTWITSPGSDDESDTLLRERCRARWATLGIGANSDWYIYYARNGHPLADQVTQVLVKTDPSGINKVTLTLAGPNGQVDSDVLTTVHSQIRAKMPLTTELEVVSAINRVVDVVGTIYAHIDDGSVKSRALEALGGYVRGLRVGDTVFWTQVVDALQFDIGIVRNADISEPDSNIELEENEVAVIGSVDLLTVESIT